MTDKRADIRDEIKSIIFDVVVGAPTSPPVADHITDPTACGDSALVSGPLAGGAADTHPSGTFRSPPDQPDESRLPPGTGIIIVGLVIVLCWAVVAA